MAHISKAFSCKNATQARFCLDIVQDLLFNDYLVSLYDTNNPVFPEAVTYGEARDTNCRDRSKRYMPLIFASNVTDINIIGGGTIDGNGKEW